ncbi:hypothetical protein [Gemmatimonas sp.]|uniref:hypothetical protein n=1 Tax=Gemmatimonas sp. TaxID=1962908 RepID=UPI0037BEED65
MHMRTRTLTALAMGLSLAAALPHAVQAQTRQPNRVVSINPFLPLDGYFQGEFEQRLKDNLAVAFSASSVELEDRYTNADVKLRLYPQERGLQGFAVAAGLGYGRIRNDNGNDYVCPAVPGFVCEPNKESTSGATFSVEMHYQWLLGKSSNTALTLGGGAKRYYVDEKKGPYDTFQRFVPTLRLTIGYAFK